MRAPWMAEMPTPPQPNTTTDEPGSTLAVLMAAPTPVVTPQPISEAISNGTSSSILTAACSGIVVYSAKVPAPAKPKIGVSPSREAGHERRAELDLGHRWGDWRVDAVDALPARRRPGDDHVVALGHRGDALADRR